MIDYKPQSDGSIRVLLDGKAVGTIRQFSSIGWQYRPRGGAPGEFFDSLAECKRSLESEDTQ